ncbi:Hsp20/alpha crystallin family protein [Natrinema zhouii]|uniref:Hsp20/alpha crystallin family protein n=1 Tax=Natrinema zhouii TaxID=1710539 RepID=A0A7D6GRV3_9EURY|nr:Hsp20/alpha crystallin family protein [Natrinema zhouii]QLK26303.1 Hsp20/alpha crystallin family protein [Natrinema zhouii]
MSEQPPNDDHDESDDDRSDEHRTDESQVDEDDHWLSSLLSALESLDDGPASTSGRRRSDRTVFDYDISIRSADDLADESPLDRDRFGGDRSRGGNGDRSRKRRIRSSGSSSDHRVATRSRDDELLVTADVAGADPDDVTVGFDDSMLVIGVEESELDRIEVPWRETESQATIKNGVLTVQIRPEPTERTGTEKTDTAETEDDE